MQKEPDARRRAVHSIGQAGKWLPEGAPLVPVYCPAGDIEEATMPVQVLMGYDGSPAANAAIDVAVQLFPHARARIAYVWMPPIANADLRQRLWPATGGVNEFVEAVEREGEQEANRIAATGVTLAGAAGWEAEALVLRCLGGEGVRVAELAEQVDTDVVVVGSRGLGGARAVLGSVSDMVVHYSPRPVLVVPHPLLIADYTALSDGPVLVGFDGSDGARTALATATRLFPTRSVLPVAVDEDDDATSEPMARDTDVIRLPFPAGHRSRSRAVAASLAACARDRAAAVLVVGSRGRSAVKEILLGSVAMATLHHSYRPVMVIPGAGRSPESAPSTPT
jgi:nucleotide-binding universal stress UspA family protein